MAKAQSSIKGTPKCIMKNRWLHGTLPKEHISIRLRDLHGSFFEKLRSMAVKKKVNSKFTIETFAGSTSHNHFAGILRAGARYIQ